MPLELADPLLLDPPLLLEPIDPLLLPLALPMLPPPSELAPGGCVVAPPHATVPIPIAPGPSAMMSENSRSRVAGDACRMGLTQD
jgi:hypothetical protein